jgi:hypothetical protein
MSASPTTVRRALAVLVVTLAGMAGTASAEPLIYDTGVPAGQVEHGVVHSTLSGGAGHYGWNWRVEYWVTADRYREQTTDWNTGELLSGRIWDSTGVTWLQYKKVNSDPKVLHFHGHDSVPGPGTPAPYNRVLATQGLSNGTPDSTIDVTLQPIGPQTIAGFAGTRYEQLTDGQPGLQGPNNPSGGESHVILVLQNGTFQPLMNEITADNGRWGTLDQKEVLVSRETHSAGVAGAPLSRRALARTIRSWKAKVAAAKRAKAKHQHPKTKATK